MQTGTVSEFGEDGWGVVIGVDEEPHRFHSTAIADGTRSIETGAAVAFRLAPGRQGLWEAVDVVAV